MNIDKNEKSILRLEKGVVEDISFKRFNTEATKIEKDAEVSFSKQLNQMEKSLYKVTVSVGINSNSVCNMNITMSGFFRLEEDSTLGKRLLQTNAVAILFPYVRSQLTLLTSQPGFDPVILPVMNINALFANEKY